MLSEEDIRSCLRVRKLLCTLRVLPLEVSIEDRTFGVQESRWKLWLCYLSYFHLLLRAFFAQLRVFHALFSGLYSKTEPHLLTWDIVMLLSSTMYGTWYAIFFIWKPANTIFMLNQAFSVSMDSSRGKTACLKLFDVMTYESSSGTPGILFQKLKNGDWFRIQGGIRDRNWLSCGYRILSSWPFS